MDRMTSLIAECAHGGLLDIATGRGEFINYLLESAPRILHGIGIDISEENLEKARQSVKHDGVSFETMAGERLRYADSAFDTVSLSLSLHHVDDPAVVLSEAWRVLRPGGCFVLFEMFSNNQSDKQMTHVLLHHWWADVDRELGTPHNHTFTDSQIQAFVKQLNWKTIDTVLVDGSEEPFEEGKTISQLKSICDMYDEKISRIDNRARAELLKVTGDSLRKRLDTIGVNWCKAICVVAQK